MRGKERKLRIAVTDYSPSFPLYLPLSSSFSPFLTLTYPKPRIFQDAIGAALIVLISFSFCFPQERDSTTTYVALSLPFAKHNFVLKYKYIINNIKNSCYKQYKKSYESIIIK